MKIKPPPIAVIYCRVSSAKQVREGHGLSSQATRCSEFARIKGYRITETFQDEGVSGGSTQRHGMNALLAYLKKHKKEQPIVLIDDISRLARGLEAHIKLRMDISNAGGKLESPSIEFGEDSDSLLVENLLASVSQHQRQKNTEQVKNRMGARVLNGYWIGTPVVGYRYEEVAGHGKLLVRDEPVASIVQEALEGFALGRFNTQTDVKNFLESHESYPKGGDGKVHYQRVASLLGRVLYAGYINLPTFGIYLQQGKHAPLISYKIFQRIQERLQRQTKAPMRSDINQDFPARGYILCCGCGGPMTSAWSTSHTKKKYAYYLCHRKGCSERSKGIPKAKVEADLEELFIKLRPSPKLFAMAKDIFNDLWEQRNKTKHNEAKTVKEELRIVERKAEKLLELILESGESVLVTTYKNKLRDLENQKAVLGDKIKHCGTTMPDFDQTFRTSLEFFANPHKLWASHRLEDKRKALELVFDQKLPYDRKAGFRTTPYSLPFGILGELEQGRYELVGPQGLEPRTNGL